ncbi:uncharacterized protein LOC112165149 isoform X2 [Rosa chinensis]|uniref:uncharacterized protein LOC112165149 isoform X2 n=1 Tax=Rosa chinensis TaxID=74649 RepID=UPI000D089522|nr:uncharacterized protein LOC112165149 isoform X2 [Rosa chinensis]
MFDLGQKAYGKRMYGRAFEFLERALTIIPRPTLFGGEIQIWLAMAYKANKRHVDCIDLYKQLENKHPSVSFPHQAAELRHIFQAPKIKITREEMVDYTTHEAILCSARQVLNASCFCLGKMLVGLVKGVIIFLCFSDLHLFSHW